jgi:hypothetical protein
MGLITLAAEFLVQARAQGTPLGRTLTLGRQSMFVSPVNLAKLLKRYNLFPAGMSDEEFYRKQFSSPYVADEFFRVLGASELISLDFAAYEGASITHDLNVPVGDELKESFDTVFDGGTLEHVFNFPTAIRNVMEMTRVGGRVFIITPSNNHFGHGFYQFSAELFYRVFSAENGFEVQRMHIAETGIFSAKLGKRPIAVEHLGTTHSIADPAQVRERVCLMGKMPSYMVVQARRVARAPIFAKPPQQSDYQAIWDEASARGNAQVAQLQFSPRWAKLKHVQLHWLPKVVRLNPLFLWRAKRERSLRNRRHFTPVHV